LWVEHVGKKELRAAVNQKGHELGKVPREHWVEGLLSRVDELNQAI
jgi:hypothetical protein